MNNSIFFLSKVHYALALAGIQVHQMEVQQTNTGEYVVKAVVTNFKTSGVTEEDAQIIQEDYRTRYFEETSARQTEK